MRTAIRIILCATLAAVAVTMAAFTVAGFTGRARTQDSLYLLRDSGGRVAVYGREDPGTPITLTDIETATLRARDRELLSQGLPVGSREELARLLEDLGS